MIPCIDKVPVRYSVLLTPKSETCFCEPLCSPETKNFHFSWSLSNFGWCCWFRFLSISCPPQIQGNGHAHPSQLSPIFFYQIEGQGSNNDWGLLRDWSWVTLAITSQRKRWYTPWAMSCSSDLSEIKPIQLVWLIYSQKYVLGIWGSSLDYFK